MWLAFLSALVLVQLNDGVPRDIIQNYVKQHSNFFVDPCADFYAHVCPDGTPGMFMAELEVAKNSLVADFVKQRPQLMKFNQQSTTKNMLELWDFINSNEIYKLSSRTASIWKNFARSMVQITSKEELEEYKKMTDEQLIEKLRSDFSVLQRYNISRINLSQILTGSIAHIHLKEADSSLRNLFFKIKAGVGKAIRSTPWAQRNGVVDLYLNSLDKIKFATWANIYAVARRALSEYKVKGRECERELYGKLSESAIIKICDVVAIGYFKRTMKSPIPNMHPNHLRGYELDGVQASNVYDEFIFMSNAFILLALTDRKADLYGGVGFSLAHEVMHTFVFDEKDYNWRNKLMPFWTKSAGCVSEQGLKTCRTFNISCNTSITFEEDAADLTAYRIMWDLYKQGTFRKTVVPGGYEELNDDQQFFYGAAVMFCQQSQRKSSQGAHASSYQRVNSIMSQMEEFSRAFNCKAADMMIQNKAKHCELYGSQASRKGFSF